MTGGGKEIPYDYEAAREAADLEGKPKKKGIKTKELQEIIQDKKEESNKKRNEQSTALKKVAKELLNDISGSDSEEAPEENKQEEEPPKKKQKVSESDTVYTVFVANLDHSVNEDELKEIFNECGEIVNCEVWRKQSGGEYHSKGKAFIDFKTEKGAKKAISKTGTKLKEKELKVELKKGSKPKGAPVKPDRSQEEKTILPSKTVFVSGLLKTTPTNVLLDFFAKAGNVSDHRFMAKKGLALIQYDDLESSRKALALNGQTLMGQTLRITYDKHGNLKRIIPEDVREQQKETSLKKKSEQEKKSTEDTNNEEEEGETEE